ncbi:MAG TPA: putative PEP-binding protein [Candidatus Dormibacteraeota bacterium]|nr:putative PEP-binding protein [Candidatus Dormibacteraeota bacterium]
MRERVLTGVGAAPGIAAGKASVLDPTIDTGGEPLRPEQRGEELARARAALAAAARDLDAIAGDLRAAGRGYEADIVETNSLMAADPSLDEAIEQLVMGSGMAAPAAIREACERSATQLAQLDDPMLALRAEDVRSLGRRAAARAAGRSYQVADGVLIGESLGPADVAELGSGVRGIALARGGVTAHAAIVARSLGLPMVVGLGQEALDVADGEEVVVDGDQGLFVRVPAAERVAAARSAAEARARARLAAVGRRELPAITRDGRRITVLANVASVAELNEALQQGAEGVGLLRTELLFLESASWPTRDQHVRFLAPILAGLTGRVATVRLLDYGGDKTPPFLRGTHERGIDLLLRSPSALSDQLAAIVTAGKGVRLRILIPMVTTPAHVRAVRASLREITGDDVVVGAMIETRDAASNATALAAECDFFSIGTNDLTQQVLGFDREHSASAPVSDPRVMRCIDAAMRAAREAGIPTDVCGEAASDAATMPLMIGLGADELSVAAARVGEVRERVRGLDYAESVRLAGALLG